MRAIIINDAAAKALLDQLELRRMQAEKNPRKIQPFESDVSKLSINDTHRFYHYTVCKWLQEQGCDVVSPKA